jgi:LPXTG-site transpeptidase (sortase) family protein
MNDISPTNTDSVLPSIKSDDKKPKIKTIITATVLIIFAAIISTVAVLSTLYYTSDISPNSEIVVPDNIIKDGMTAITRSDSIDNSITPLLQASDLDLAGGLDHIHKLYENQKFGDIYSDFQNIKSPLIWGATDANLTRGSAAHVQSSPPGEAGGILIGGHDYGPFRQITNFKSGDTFVIETDYGIFTYEVNDSRVENYKTRYPWNTIADKSRKTAILYTCYPVTVLHPQTRYIVTGELISSVYK